MAKTETKVAGESDKNIDRHRMPNVSGHMACPDGHICSHEVVIDEDEDEGKSFETKVGDVPKSKETSGN